MDTIVVKNETEFNYRIESLLKCIDETIVSANNIEIETTFLIYD